eukprot:2423390-Pyramimonas_sp.AAC.1
MEVHVDSNNWIHDLPAAASNVESHLSAISWPARHLEARQIKRSIMRSMRETMPHPTCWLNRVERRRVGM